MAILWQEETQKMKNKQLAEIKIRDSLHNNTFGTSIEKDIIKTILQQEYYW